MDSVFFGLTTSYYDRLSGCPRVAINGSNVFVEVHQDSSNRLWYRCGHVDGVATSFKAAGKIKNSSASNDGYRPAVAVRGNTVIEMHDGGGNGSLWYWTGSINSDYSITWVTNGKYDDGESPTVAVDRNGIIVEVHTSTSLFGSGDLWYSTFQMNGTSAPTPLKNAKIGGDGIDEDKGYHASVAINSRGVVVEVHDSGGVGGIGAKLWYWIGQLQSDKSIQWIGHDEYDGGQFPSVTIDDNDIVYEIHQSEADIGDLWQRVGRVVHSGGTARIDWYDYFGQDQHSYWFSKGYRPAIGGNGSTAIHVHQSPDGTSSDLYCNAALIFDRGNWMGQNLATFGARRLDEIVMPGSHDAGMYLGGFDLAVLGKTQDLTIHGQLLDGTRYFDLRPLYDESDDYLYIHHGTIKGPKLDAVLGQVDSFLSADPTRRELIILKFSHYENFGEPVDCANPMFQRTVNKIEEILGRWLYKEAVPPGERLASYPLNHFIENGARVLVVCDQVGSQCQPGIFSYRDWYSDDPQNGDLTVFDIYSYTFQLDVMMNSLEQNEEEPPLTGISGVPRGQIPKFQGPGADGRTNLYDGFSGQCLNGGVQCDFFLLSWTLTSPVGAAVWSFAVDANGALVDNIPSNSGNKYGQMVNVIYVDYVEYARSIDLAYVRNGLGPQTSAAKEDASSELLEQSP